MSLLSLLRNIVMTFFGHAPKSSLHKNMTMMARFIVLLLLLLLTSSTTTFALQNDDEQDIAIQQSLVDWIRSEGGFFHPHQEFRRASPTSPLGIFATSTIKKGEVLTSIPWHAVLTAGKDEFDTGLHCYTIRLLLQEMKQVEQHGESKFAPYIRYLLARPPVDIPSTYSRKARELLENMVAHGTLLPPSFATNWVQDWQEECHGNISNKREVQAAMLVLSRGDDDLLIPIYDLYNHRNGKWFNTKNVVVEGEKHEIRALRDIEAGEEIFNSYNQCTNCYNRHADFGTPEIFRDYGFVEQYPQRWVFRRQKLAFDVDENSKGELHVRWLDYPPFDETFQVTQHGLDYLYSQLQRLQVFHEKELQPLLDGTATLPKSELENIMQYYEALTTALSMAVKAGKEYDFGFSDDNDDDDDDEEEEEEAAVVVKDDTSLQQGVVQWIRTNAGIFNRKQEFRRETPGDPTSLFGIFAKQDIKKGEKLLLIPWELVLTAGTDDTDDDTFHCDSARFIANEMKLGAKSVYGPYIKYLLASPPVNIPSMWSEKAKNVLNQIIDHEALPPKRAVQWVRDWKQDCGITEEEVDPFELQAAMLLVSRGDDDTLTPVYDMYNHRNGRFFNAQSHQREVRHEIVAYRDIKKGEQVYISYNQCSNCHNRFNNYGTPELFRDYGFVEAFPQRWVFHDQEIAFDIQGESDGGYTLFWLDGRQNKHFDELYQVTKVGIDFLKSHLKRLKGLNETLLQPLVVDSEKSSQEVIPKNELDTILKYYEALTRAIEMAVKAYKTYDYVPPEDMHDDDDNDDEEEVEIAPEKPHGGTESSNEDDLEDDEDDDDDDDEWSDDVDCPGGMFVKGKCVTEIRKWEEL